MNLLMLISLINTKLRDTTDSLENICYDLGLDLEKLKVELEQNDYYFSADNRQIKQK